MTGVTRRQLLIRGGGATLVLFAAGAGPALAQNLADPTALSAARSATVLALLAAIAADPGADLAPDAVELVASDFGEAYAAAPADVRAFADDTLDRVKAEQPGGFAILSPAESLAVLQGWSSAGPADGAAGDPHRTLAASALALAGLAGGEDESRQVGYTLEGV
jgi:hypothetical protein